MAAVSASVAVASKKGLVVHHVPTFTTPDQHIFLDDKEQISPPPAFNLPDAEDDGATTPAAHESHEPFPEAPSPVSSKDDDDLLQFESPVQASPMQATPNGGGGSDAGRDEAADAADAAHHAARPYGDSDGDSNGDGDAAAEGANPLKAPQESPQEE